MATIRNRAREHAVVKRGDLVSLSVGRVTRNGVMLRVTSHELSLDHFEIFFGHDELNALIESYQRACRATTKG